MGNFGRFHFLGLIVSRDRYMNMCEVIQPAEEDKLEANYHCLRSCRDAESFYFGLLRLDLLGPNKGRPFDT